MMVTNSHISRIRNEISLFLRQYGVMFEEPTGHSLESFFFYLSLLSVSEICIKRVLKLFTALSFIKRDRILLII